MKGQKMTRAKNRPNLRPSGARLAYSWALFKKRKPMPEFAARELAGDAARSHFLAARYNMKNGLRRRKSKHSVCEHKKEKRQLCRACKYRG